MKYKIVFVLLPLIVALCGCGNKYEKTYVITAENGVNIRSTPSTSGKVLEKKLYYQSVEVESIDKGWAKIQYGDGYAYVDTRYIKKFEGLGWSDVPFTILLIVVLLGGGGVAGAKMLKKDGTPDMRYKKNRR